MIARTPWALAALTLALAGCAPLGPDYARPASSLPGAYPAERFDGRLFFPVKGYGLKQAGYATNPRYPELLIRIIEENGLEQYDRARV